MSDFKTVLHPASVSCPRPLPDTTAHKCEFTLNIGIFMDGTDNNKATNEVPSANTNTNIDTDTNIVRLWQPCRKATKRLAGTLIRRLVTTLGVMSTAALMTACATESHDLVPQKDMVGASISAVGHLGSMIGIPEFYVNGHWGGNNSGWGGGGGACAACCCPARWWNP